jgi:hypothetical protein
MPAAFRARRVRVVLQPWAPPAPPPCHPLLLAYVHLLLPAAPGAVPLRPLTDAVAFAAGLLRASAEMALQRALYRILGLFWSGTAATAIGGGNGSGAVRAEVAERYACGSGKILRWYAKCLIHGQRSIRDGRE